MGRAMNPLRLALACLALIGPARATTVIPPSFPELVAEAECIVRGTVTAVEARAVPTPRGEAIHTFVTVAVEECLKGAAPRTLTLTLAGGTLGEKRAAIAGMPQFKAGDREILFVQGNGRQLCPLVGFFHGRYRVLTDATTGRDYVARSNGLPLTSIAEVGSSLPDPARLPAVARAASAGLTPAEFLAQVRTELVPVHAGAR